MKKYTIKDLGVLYIGFGVVLSTLTSIVLTCLGYSLGMVSVKWGLTAVAGFVVILLVRKLTGNRVDMIMRIVELMVLHASIATLGGLAQLNTQELVAVEQLYHHLLPIMLVASLLFLLWEIDLYWQAYSWIRWQFVRQRK